MTIVPAPLQQLQRRVRRQVPASFFSQYAILERAHPEVIEQYKTLRAEWRAEMGRLSALSRSQQHHRVRKLLKNRRYHWLFAFRGLHRSKRLANATADTISALASQCNPFAPVRDEMIIPREVRTGSGKRIVFDFGPIRRAHQYMVADILKHLHPPPANQKLFNGGMPMAKAAIEAAYRNRLTFGVEVDIVNFYGSVILEGLAEPLRPLPTSVVEHVVWDMYARSDDATSLHSTSSMYPTSSIRPGLSLGSATSSIVGEIIIARALGAAQLSEMVTYADNVFLQGSTRREVEALQTRLEDGFASAPVGSLETRPLAGLCDMSNGFQFAKQEVQVVDGAFHWGPGAQKLNQYMVSAQQHLPLSMIETAERRISNWRRYYPDWRDGDAWEAEYLAATAARKFYADASPANLSAAVHATVVALAAWYELKPVEEIVVALDGGAAAERRSVLLEAVQRWLNNARQNTLPTQSRR